MSQVLFHLAFPVTDIAQAKEFYGVRLGCAVGRENDNSVILNLYGHQLVAHLSHDPLAPQKGIYPRHFGLIFTAEADWEALLERSLRHHLDFYVKPKHRFEGSPLEHRTFFLADPFGNLMEFKYYVNPNAVFGELAYTQVGDRV
ncbi:VOC family protein [Egbenema bharatensis]|uniref:VOC family protein n=1 Tax=Egbenema bharatensis TaxID=3463334 RepID=UPI003A86B443